MFAIQELPTHTNTAYLSAGVMTGDLLLHLDMSKINKTNLY